MLTGSLEATAHQPEEEPVLDFVFIAGTFAFFALACGYVALCDRL